LNSEIRTEGQPTTCGLDFIVSLDNAFLELACT